MPPIPIDAMRSLWARAYHERAHFDHVDKDGISHTRDGTSIWVYGVVIGGSIALVLLVLSTVYKQDYAQRRNNRSLRVEEHRPRLNSEKIEDLRAVGRTEDGSQAGQGIAR